MPDFLNIFMIVLPHLKTDNCQLPGLPAVV